MNKLRFAISLGAALVFTLISASFAQAQFRTWVSGVGDDMFPCSRTAPCKTFSKAHSVTSANGEINVLDAGAYGTLTITKSMTIDGGEAFSSILAASATGVSINAAGAHVILRNLSINGNGNGIDGIRVIQAASVLVENCVIFNFTGQGIDWSPLNSDGVLTVRNVTFSGCLGGGISALNSTGSVRASIENCSFHRGAYGVRAGSLAVVTVTDSTATATTDGFLANSASAQMNLDRCVATNNTNGVKVDNGAAIRISKCNISTNITNGLKIVSGIIESYNTNMIRGNPLSDASTPVGQS